MRTIPIWVGRLPFERLPISRNFPEFLAEVLKGEYTSVSVEPTEYFIDDHHTHIRVFYNVLTAIMQDGWFMKILCPTESVGHSEDAMHDDGVKALVDAAAYSQILEYRLHRARINTEVHLVKPQKGLLRLLVHQEPHFC